ncbi:MAG: hypothetical protein PHF99_12550 [Bacteroidales bacterium]|nr:hypothetical protein [Bacteroidales bacterium]
MSLFLKYKKIIVFSCVILLIIIAHFILTSIITYYQPLTVDFKNISEEDFKNIVFSGISPFNRDLTDNIVTSKTKFSTKENILLKEVKITSSQPLIIDSIIVEFSHGDKRTQNRICVFENVDIENGILLTNHFKPPKKIFIFYLTLIQSSKYFMAFILLFLMIIVIYLAYYLNKKVLVTTKTRSQLSSSKLFKKRVVKYLNYKTIGIVLLMGLIIQIVLFSLNSFPSTCILSGTILWGLLWCVTIFIIVKFKKSNQSNWLLAINSLFISIIIIEIFLCSFNITTTRYEAMYGKYSSQYRSSNANHFIKREPFSIESSIREEFLFYRELNNYGYSDKDWYREDMKDKYKILAIGDSSTEGDGTVADSTYLKFLEYELNDTMFYFLNGGICGSDPIFDYIRLKNVLINLKPQLVISCINFTDIYDVIIRGGFSRFQDDGSIVYNKAPWWEFLYASNHTLRLFFKLLVYEGTLLTKNQLEIAKEDAFMSLIQAVDSVNSLCKQNGADNVFVIHPFKYDINNLEFDKDYLINYMIRNEIKHIDLFEYYSKREIIDNIDYYYWIIDAHHNAKGYKLMAEGIYEGLVEYGFFQDTIVTDSIILQ